MCGGSSGVGRRSLHYLGCFLEVFWDRLFSTPESNGMLVTNGSGLEKPLQGLGCPLEGGRAPRLQCRGARRAGRRGQSAALRRLLSAGSPLLAGFHQWWPLGGTRWSLTIAAPPSATVAVSQYAG